MASQWLMIVDGTQKWLGYFMENLRKVDVVKTKINIWNGLEHL